MSGDVIKSFLVSLGFDVDTASLANFNRSIASATLKVTALYASTKIAATGIAYGISKISESFEQLGYEYKLVAPAINRTILLRKEMLKAYSAAGVNLVKVIQDSVKLNFSLTKTKYAFEAIYKSVASRFFPLLTKQSDIFRKKLYDNMPKIQAALERFVSFVFKAFEITTDFGARLWSILSRVYDLFVQLDRATSGWSTILLGALVAWKAFNLGFLATPLGMILALGTALVVLYDDFMTFREGGESLINWGSETTKVFVGLAGAILGISAAVVAVSSAYRLWVSFTKAQTIAQWALNLAMSANPIGLIIAGVTALLGLLVLLDSKWNLFGGHVSGFFGGIGGKILDFVGGANVANNLGAGALGGGAPLLGGNTQNTSHSNQQITSNANFNIVSPDAAAAGSSVQNAYQNVVRDMQGSIRPAGVGLLKP